MKIGYALLLGMMVFLLYPRAKHMLKNSPKASGDDWRAVLIPLVLLVLFLIFLVKMV
ncbi:MAG TPA: hypothetical protein VIQ03_06995 [Gammaproteobacteria bacterium]